VALVRLLPEGAAAILAGQIGGLLYHLLPARRAVGLKNLAIAFPDEPERRRRRILRQSFRNLARTAVEFVRFAGWSAAAVRERVTYDPEFRKLLARHPAAVLATAHLGNWELLALAYSHHGLPVMLVARRLANSLLNASMQRLRERGGNIVLESGGGEAGLSALLAHLRVGGTAGLVVDHYPGRRNGVQVDFFGHKAWCHRGPALLAVRAGVPVIPSFLRRDPRGRGRFIIYGGPPIFPGGRGSARERVAGLTQELQRVVENEIRARPEEWLWTHRRWKRTDEAGDLYGDTHRRRRRKLVASSPAAPAVVSRTSTAG
jgi:KDO2-lipid IV(A) lauroyltransferase